MPDSPGDDNDSRTASVGLQRARTSSSSGASRASSHDSSIGKGRPRKKRQTDRSDIRDFVPQGTKFSAIPLDAEPDSTSSSGSDASSSNDSGNEDAGEQNRQPPLGGSAPAINWNQGSKSAIRTTLGGRVSKPERNVTTSSFDEVNKFWHSRSASVTSAEEEGEEVTSSHNKDSKVDSPDVELKDTNTAPSGQGPYFVHSDDSESGEVSEGDDSIMVNVGARPGNTMESQGHTGRANGTAVAHTQYGSTTTNGSGANEKSTPHSKEDSFQSFSSKYPTPPSTLSDLVHEDLQIQVKYLFYGRDEGDLDLTLPVTCTECFQEGHLAEVCPSKEVSYPSHFTTHLSSCSIVALKIRVIKQILIESSVNTAEPGINMRVTFVLPGEDARNVASGDTIMQHVPRP
ncbi:hypothetical protein Plec18170_003801 [Paecilomyces lecythidis]